MAATRPPPPILGRLSRVLLALIVHLRLPCDARHRCRRYLASDLHHELLPAPAAWMRRGLLLVRRQQFSYDTRPIGADAFRARDYFSNLWQEVIR